MSISSLSNSGLEKGKFYATGASRDNPTPALVVDYAIIGGGGGGGNGYNNYRFGGGGGGGGYSTSFSTDGSGGRRGTLDSFTLNVGTNYTVTIGGGGALSARGGDTIFHNITEKGGGCGQDAGNNSPNHNGANGGGGSSNSNTSDSTNDVSYYGLPYDDNLGFNGGWAIINTNEVLAGSRSGGGGGGARGIGSHGRGRGGAFGGAGIDSNITGSEINVCGGGGAFAWVGGYGAYVDSSAGGYNNNAPANRGGGGGGSKTGGNNNAISGTLGGSGRVILRYPDIYTITVGAGLTAGSETAVGTNEKYIDITAGTGNVSWAFA